MKKLRSLVLLASLASLGCYHAIIDTGRPPSGQTVKKEWAHSWLYGLVPPSVVETATQCPNGAAKVETQHSVVNMLAAFLTGGIYTPMTIDVQCAAAGRDDLLLVQDANTDSQQFLTTAATRSLATGQPVWVDLR